MERCNEVEETRDVLKAAPQQDGNEKVRYTISLTTTNRCVLKLKSGRRMSEAG